MPTVLYPDPFSVQLLESEPLVVTTEQQRYIREILEVSSSDTRFAEKAYIAIWKVLTGGNVVPPVVTSLTPSTAVLGSASFDLHVIGTGFSPTSEIIFNGGVEPTTFVSETELTTGVDMTTVLAPATVPISVVTDGVVSDSMDFEFTAVVLQSASASKKIETVKQESKASVEPQPPFNPKDVKKDK